LRAALDRIGDRWLLLVVEALADGPQRFGEVADRIGAAPNIVSDRLRRLEVEGLVASTPYETRPLRLVYELTASGRELHDALVPLAAWGGAVEGIAPERFHDACGTAVELRPWCPTCDRPVGPDETPGVVEL
jgi:DNA-binding HxlR family transcriptional regulator